MTTPSEYIVTLCANEDGSENNFVKFFNACQGLLCRASGIPIFGVVPAIFQLVWSVVTFAFAFLILPFSWLVCCIGNDEYFNILMNLMGLCFFYFWNSIFNISMLGFYGLYFEIILPRINFNQNLKAKQANIV